MTSFGEWIRERRLTLRLKAFECAERAGMKPQMWSDWENDRSRKADGSPMTPRPETIRRIAAALEVPPAEAMRAAGLLTERDEEPDFAPDSDHDHDYNTDEASIVAYYNGLPDPVREDVREMLEALYKKHQRDKTTHGKKAE